MNMADNISTNGNSWTILPPEVKESEVESVGPLSEGQEEPNLTCLSALSDKPSEQTPDLPQVTPLEGSDDAAVSPSATVEEDAADSVPDDVENLTSVTPELAEQGASGETSESQPLNPFETDSFSDSYTHISPSPVSTSVPGVPEDEELELSHAGEKCVLRKTLNEEFKPEEKAAEGEGLRKRNVSVLTSVYHREEEEEEEEGEEVQFKHPQRGGDGDLGFTLNKCIFGVLLLLGLGTLFFSGVLLDLDDEGDADIKDPKYAQQKKEWLNADPQGDTPGGVQPPDILDKLAKENQHIASLEAQLQKQEVELKAAQLQVEESSKERLRRDELEAENQRMRGELDKLPALQKEYQQESERVKRENERVNKELQALPAMQKELDRLKDQVTELTQAGVQAGAPSAGHEELLQERKVRKAKKAEEKERKEEGLKAEKKEGKKDKHLKVTEQHHKGKDAKDQKEGEKQGRHKGEGKNRKEEAERWKLDSEKRVSKERTGKREWKDEKKGEKEKHGEFGDGKGDKKGKEGKSNEWKEEKEWKKGKQASRNDKERKERSEKKKDWKERREWGDEREKDDDGYKSQRGGKNGKGKKDDRNENGERKDREEKRRSGKEKDKRGDGRKVERKSKKNIKEEQASAKGRHEASRHLYSERTRGEDHVHADYWAQQRDKIRHFYGSTDGCDGAAACASAEGLAPVSQDDFQAFLSGYLAKLEGRREETSRREELGTLMDEFFTDGFFVHDQIPFSEFVEDVEDILEDLAEDGDGDDELEKAMDGFAVEAMEKFTLQEREGNEEARRGRGKKRMKG